MKPVRLIAQAAVILLALTAYEEGVAFGRDSWNEIDCKGPVVATIYESEDPTAWYRGVNDAVSDLLAKQRRGIDVCAYLRRANAPWWLPREK